MIAVIYNDTGKIVQSISGHIRAVENTAAAMHMSYLALEAVPEGATLMSLDETHRVQDGELVPV